MKGEGSAVMQPIRAALIQMGWTGSRASMQDRCRELVSEAARRGAALMGLPELSLSPYFPSVRDPAGFAWAEPLPGGESDRFFAELARANRIMLIGSLFERTSDGHHYDTAVVYDAEGRLVGVTRKVHLPSGEGYHETDFFEPGDSHPVHDLGLLRIAAPTCYDQWFPELARIYGLSGAEFIFYPTAIGSEPTAPDVDTQEAWQTIMRAHAIANGVFVGAANRVGTENGVTFYGSSFIADPMGRVLAQAGRATVEVIAADLDPNTLTRWRALFPLLRQRMPSTYGALTAYSPNEGDTP
jgi:N-carbamoylputrescine amidase